MHYNWRWLLEHRATPVPLNSKMNSTRTDGVTKVPVSWVENAKKNSIMITPKRGEAGNWFALTNCLCKTTSICIYLSLETKTTVVNRRRLSIMQISKYVATLRLSRNWDHHSPEVNVFSPGQPSCRDTSGVCSATEGRIWPNKNTAICQILSHIDQ